MAKVKEIYDSVIQSQSRLEMKAEETVEEKPDRFFMGQNYEWMSIKDTLGNNFTFCKTKHGHLIFH